MYKKIATLFLACAIILPPNICLSVPTKQKIDNVVVEVGRGTRDIAPFLEKIVRKWGRYFERVYGVYRDENIVINVNANSLYLTFDEIIDIGNALAQEIAVTYPLCDATLIISVPKDGQAWHKLQWEIEDGEILSYSDS